MSEMDTEISALRSLIQGSKRIVVFTGAGISTESGIPDFRGPGGIWKKIAPIDFRDFIASEDVRRESWRRKFSGVLSMAEAEPNAGHQAISKLVSMNKLLAIITQNVDGLHQKSGVPEDLLIELHGNANYASCLDCHQRFELDEIEQSFKKDESVPYCDSCGGMIKTATISFGQGMPQNEMLRAEKATYDCDLFMAIGSSLVVYPAAGFPRMAKQNGIPLVILNNETTDLDPIADLVIHQQIGPTLSAAI